MDLVICAAPLDNSFQKEKLELVNKGSLGRRRKPSRSNLKLLLSPSTNSALSPSERNLTQSTSNNNTSQLTSNNSKSQSTSFNSTLQSTSYNSTSQSAPSTPACEVQKVIVNGIKEQKTSRNFKKGLKTESSLPRTPTCETNHYVNDAQQFTIEAKLKRRKSDSGRSAVLIQTWERRTRCDSFSRQSKPKTIARTNRFQNKENLGGTSNMPDSHAACPKYSGNFKNNQWSKDGGGFVASVRDGYANETMLYRTPINGQSYDRVAQTNMNNHKPTEQEPEWISLSRKLRAKFVEGHIEPSSADSYLHEEPVRVQPVVQKEPIRLPQQQKNQAIPQHQKEQAIPQHQNSQKVEKKIRVVVDTSESRNQNGEPPWVQLSRKLCTKFIEEHIEYPVVCNNVPTREATEVECNGDIRIIEKIGKPKERKSKIRKESEPEWVSLSKKLRAKFIESHIDDPDTISLDNQLNASDPEETSSESLSDSTPEVSPSKKTYNKVDNCERTTEIKVNHHKGNQEIHDTVKKSNGLLFPEKECCWEYQEMEFDQESNSGTFQESEIFEENTPDTTRNGAGQLISNHRFISTDHEKRFDSDAQVCSNSMSFVETINCEPFHNAECYNNDVRFPSHINESLETLLENSAIKKKYITVQIVARPDSKLPDFDESYQITSRSSPLGFSPRSNKCDFFNISTWEEAHFKSGDTDSEQNLSPCQEVRLSKNFKSKSMDDLCEAKEENFVGKPTLKSKKEYSKVQKTTSLLSKASPISKSETVLHQIKPEIIVQNGFNDLNDSKNHRISVEESQSSASSKCESEYDSNENLKNKLEDNHNVKTSEKLTADPSSHNARQHQKSFDPKKQFKCNGFIPNARKDLLSNKKDENFNKDSNRSGRNDSNEVRAEANNDECKKLNQTVCRNEYANINPLTDVSTSKNRDSCDPDKFITRSKSTQSVCEKVSTEGVRTVEHFNPRHDYASVTKNGYESSDLSPKFTRGDLNIKHDTNDVFESSAQMRIKSKSLCDISKHKELTNLSDEMSGRPVEKGSRYGMVKSKDFSEMKFQHFASEADIPLCAKLIKQNGKCSVSSISSSSNRNTSPCSESSHVYEDMFKETTSCPSDSETSSWTAVKNNSYYINGRSSSMNDLDYSDSCSLSVKCDYASSCSEQSTLQSRHSSCTSSSFYVNLRDYDSHMLEPSLNRRKDHNRRLGNGNTSKINSNPPTPESLRHLFTSPFNSAPNRGNRLLNKLPSEPEIHYYSTASVTSSAFKHGFDPSPPKPKKSERSSSIKIKDIAHGIILTFRKFQNHSKNSHVSSTHYVDVSHLAESGSKTNNSDSNKPKSKKDHNMKKHERKGLWGFPFENGKTDSDSGCHLSAPDVQRAKARRCSSDLTGIKQKLPVLHKDTIFSENISVQEKKKSKSGKKNSNAREKGKKSRSKSVEPKTIPTVSRKVQQMADGTLCLVTTVSGDTTLPGVYSDSPDTSSELSSYKPVKPTGESNC